MASSISKSDKSLDQALKAMSIADDEDEPLVLSGSAAFSSKYQNSMSLMGRLLNPDSQTISNAIWDLPRKWSLVNRVRGVALSEDQFQFFFKSQEDLDGVMKIGVWTPDDWCVTLEKWTDDPPDDYLNLLPVWIKIKKIPVDHYTEEAIREMASVVGEIIDEDFDLSKSQSRIFVRLRVLFDVSKPLRYTKKVLLENGSLHEVEYVYERIRKKCFQCNRLTHDKLRCPLNPLNQQRLQTALQSSLKPDDPLHGVLTEEQLNAVDAAGIPRFSVGELNHMRQYLLASEGPERQVQEWRIKDQVCSILGVVQNIADDRRMVVSQNEPDLRIISPEQNGEVMSKRMELPTSSSISEKQKKIINDAIDKHGIPDDLLDEAIQMSLEMLRSRKMEKTVADNIIPLVNQHASNPLEPNNVFQIGTNDALSSGSSSSRRPTTWRRQNSNKGKAVNTRASNSRSSSAKSVATKRRLSEFGGNSAKTTKRDQSRVDPVDSPKDQ